MDPLSLIGGIVALLQTGKGMVKGFEKLRSLKEAPSEVIVLANEVCSLPSSPLSLVGNGCRMTDMGAVRADYGPPCGI